jgi:hypothetical protein
MQTSLADAKFEVFTAVRFQVMVFWVVTPCIDVLRYLHLHGEDGGSMVFQSTGLLPHHYMVSQPRRQWFVS